MIIVTGATGQLGKAIVEHLAGRHPANQIGVSVRDPDKAADLAAMGVRVRRGDFADADTLPHAFEGATQVLIVSSNASASGGDPVAQHRSAIDAARAAGARRIVYTSHMGVSNTSAFPPMRDHHATEALLSESGLAWTALRNGFYAASGIALMGDALTTGVINAPADGKVAWTAHADLAAAAAIVLIDEACRSGPTPPLTGSQSLNMADLASISSDALGSPVARRLLTERELRAQMTARGAPDRAASVLVGLYAASRAGDFATVDPTLEALLGRPTICMRELIADKVNHQER